MSLCIRKSSAMSGNQHMSCAPLEWSDSQLSSPKRKLERMINGTPRQPRRMHSYSNGQRTLTKILKKPPPKGCLNCFDKKAFAISLLKRDRKYNDNYFISDT